MTTQPEPFTGPGSPTQRLRILTEDLLVAQGREQRERTPEHVAERETCAAYLAAQGGQFRLSKGMKALAAKVAEERLQEDVARGQCGCWRCARKSDVTAAVA